jgi:hypothetical protein
MRAPELAAASIIVAVNPDLADAARRFDDPVKPPTPRP